MGEIFRLRAERNGEVGNRLNLKAYILLYTLETKAKQSNFGGKR